MESRYTRREKDSDNNHEERETNAIASAKVEITINDFHEWVHGYPKDDYPKLLTPRTEIKVNAEVDFFDPEFLESFLNMQEVEI